MTDELDHLLILEEEAGERLDKILARRFTGIKSRTYFQMLISEERILVNGELPKKRDKLSPGDEIQIHFILTPEIGLTPENIPLDILYEDEDLIAVNKPVGMVVHPATGNWTGTFVNALLYYCKQLSDGTERPGIVHRLDKDTSGVLLAAKTPLAQQRLIELFASRQMQKEYLAICLGKPGNGTIDAPIGRHPVNRQMMSVREGGKPAISHFKTLVTNDAISLVQIIPTTGRTHQIRVHLKHQGYPVLGDAVYGSPQANLRHKASRQLLHAHRLKFTHPFTTEQITLEAPLPSDMHFFVA